MERKKHTRISAYAILVQNGFILLVRCSPSTDAPGRWTLPGGGIEFGEDPAHAAVREVKEETGLNVELERLVTVNSQVIHAKETDHHAIRFLYYANIIGGELISELNGSTDLAKWLRLSDISGYPLTDVASLAVKTVAIQNDAK